MYAVVFLKKALHVYQINIVYWSPNTSNISHAVITRRTHFVNYIFFFSTVTIISFADDDFYWVLQLSEIVAYQRC